MSTARCIRCGTTARVSSKATADDWWHQHKETCVARRVGRTGVSHVAPVRRARIDSELAELLATARRYKPIPIAATVSSPSPAPDGWTRLDIDRWGAREAGGPKWTRRDSCLMSAIAYMIGATDIATIPDNTDLADNPDWLPRYNQRLARIGIRLEQISSDRGLASHNWIAVLDDESADHAIAACKQFVRFDPAGRELGGLPVARVKYGLEIVPARTPKRDRWGRSLAA